MYRVSDATTEMQYWQGNYYHRAYDTISSTPSCTVLFPKCLKFNVPLRRPGRVASLAPSCSTWIIHQVHNPLPTVKHEESYSSTCLKDIKKVARVFVDSSSTCILCRHITPRSPGDQLLPDALLQDENAVEFNGRILCNPSFRMELNEKSELSPKANI